MKLKLHILDYASFAALLVYSASATITPVCLLTMSKELNFTLSAGGGIEASRSMLILLSLFFGGFAAAKIGKVRSLCAGLFGLAAGYAVYAYAPSYPAVLCASIIVGASCGIIEGLLNPLVQELHKDDAGRYLNISNAFWSVGVLSTVIVSGELLTLGISWRLIMAVLSCCSLAVGIFFAALKKNEQKPKGLKTSSVIRQYADCLSSKRFWVFCFMMVLAGGSEGAFTFWSASYIQVHFNALPRMGGAGTACFAAGMMCMRLASGFLAGQNKLRRLIFFSAAGGALLACAVPFVTSAYVFFPLLFSAGVSIACFWPSIQAYAVIRITHLDSTAAFILMSCAGIPGFGLISFIMGIIGDKAGLNKSFFLVPALLALLALTVLIERGGYPFFKQRKAAAGKNGKKT